VPRREQDRDDPRAHCDSDEHHPGQTPPVTAAMAIGPAMTTLKLVPELIVDQARSRHRGCAHRATSSA